MALLSVIALASAATQSAGACAVYQGQTISPVPISSVFSELPAISRKDQFESTEVYNRRLEASRNTVPATVLVFDRPWGDSPPSYNADKGTLNFYPSNFGQRGLNFQDVLLLGIGQGDAFGGIGFEVTRKISGRSSHEATNGFGARFTVERTEQEIDAIWERPLKLGESAFVRATTYKPLVQLSVSPSQARDIVEGGGSAIVATPKPPFVQIGTTAVRATFSSPREVLKNVRVLWADVHCVLAYDRTKHVVLAFDVK